MLHIKQVANLVEDKMLSSEDVVIVPGNLEKMAENKHKSTSLLKGTSLLGFERIQV